MIVSVDVIRLLNEFRTMIDSFNRIKEATCENFNIFSVLQMESDEVATHSRFITHLLNKKGKHGKKNLFLKKFMEFIDDYDFDHENYYVRIEYSVGPLSEDGTKGGRIDILLQDVNHQVILIENKIFAAEQPNQLLRYRNAFKNAKIIYLTLNGEPSKMNPIGVDYQSMSYKINIIDWLIECQKETIGQPIIRETLTQYINLIKKLTNQNINKEMSDALTERLLKEKSTFEAYIALLNSSTSIKQKMVNDISEKLKDELMDFENIETIKENKDIGRLISFDNLQLRNNNLSIRFNFEKNDYSMLIFGFYIINPDQPIPEGLFEKFQSIFPRAKKSIQYPAYMEYENYSDWSLRNLSEIYFDIDFYLDFHDKIRLMISII